jgi:hypothetical protein
MPARALVIGEGVCRLRLYNAAAIWPGARVLAALLLRLHLSVFAGDITDKARA